MAMPGIGALGLDQYQGQKRPTKVSKSLAIDILGELVRIDIWE